MSVCPVHCGKTADWDSKSDGSTDKAGSWVWEGVILGANVGHPIVTNREFAA